MNANDFSRKAQAAVAAGRPMVVEILPAMDNLSQENVLDVGMRGRVIGVRTDNGYGDEAMYIVSIDLTDFEEFNKPFEKANWFVGSGPTLDTARNTGNWPKNNIDDIWFGGTDEVDQFLKVLEDGDNFYNEYLAAGVDMTYIEWLELQVKYLRKTVGEKDNFIQDTIAKEPLQLRKR